VLLRTLSFALFGMSSLGIAELGAVAVWFAAMATRTQSTPFFLLAMVFFIIFVAATVAQTLAFDALAQKEYGASIRHGWPGLVALLVLSPVVYYLATLPYWSGR
jgi:predicted membrane channel-forming protein YqfA (hemolysin III family)